MACDIAKNGKRLVETNYDIDKVADMMIKTYQEVVRNAKRGPRKLPLG